MVRVLCTGDVHIGRLIAGVPDDLPLVTRKTANAWSEIVSFALRERPDLVAISGDIVDERNKFFEAIGPLESGMRSLAAAGIPVVAVAGNHDWDVLPEIAGRFNGALTLLGANRSWERWTLESGGRPVLHVDGWSFPSRHVVDDPLDSYPFSHPETTPVLGIVHVDVGSSLPRYAPTTYWKLQSKQVDAWLIGHVHVPRLFESQGSPPVLYPGSPFAMDPAETGAHGLWMLSIEPDGPAHFTQVVLSPVRFETLEVDVTGQSTEQGVTDCIQRDVVQLLARLTEAPGGIGLQLLQVRITLVGALSHSIPLEAAIRTIVDAYRPTLEGATAVVTKVESRATLAINLDALAGTTSVVGVLATLMQTPMDALRIEVRAHVLATSQKKEFTLLEGGVSLSNSEIDSMLEREAWRLLSVLDSQIPRPQ